MVGNKWKKRSNMSIGLVNVPFFNMMNFSTTCGMGLNGARSMNKAITIRTGYEILSRIANMIIHRKLKQKIICYLSGK
jgi:hypothetical protein